MAKTLTFMVLWPCIYDEFHKYFYNHCPSLEFFIVQLFLDEPDINLINGFYSSEDFNLDVKELKK